jgi:thymidylate kinase
MIRISSLLGPSGVGKSTAAEGTRKILESTGHTVKIIKKDDAIRELSSARFGPDEPFGAFTVKGVAGSDRISQADLHRHMNTQIKSALDDGNLVLLEGGTRTRKAQRETMSGVLISDEEFRIFMMQLPFREVIKRLRERRSNGDREDDRLPIIGAKLAGQYLRPILSSDAPRVGDSDVIPIDAAQHPNDISAEIARRILGDVD